MSPVMIKANSSSLNVVPPSSAHAYPLHLIAVSSVFGKVFSKSR